MRNSIRVADIDGAVGQDGAEEGADDALSLVGASDIAIADVEDDQRMYLRRQASGGRRRRRKLQHCVLARHSLSLSLFSSDRSDSLHATARRQCVRVCGCARERERPQRKKPSRVFIWGGKKRRHRTAPFRFCCYWAC